ncbi:LysR family transcriptional regulator [Tateyamaria omphalii]|uniref:HTH lysR-type domain-containing protein n=1 Tax=Tateyamaria omphalii TaxID=299262 RepID=A0A1P8MZC9_9RHOB|nr:LysR family transcriptional regulator [Tateyamaria omphalii]APX13393.1 hypothetical protein BWR18_18165 [Tateyamaria omphalii]
MPALDLADYRAIVAIFTHRHFGRAAEHLGVSQPSLTSRLKRMEARMGARFFERDRKGVEPTAVGLALFDSAQDVLLSAETAERAARDAAEGRGHIIRVGFTQISAQTVLVDALSAFRMRHPKLRLRLTEASSAQLERGLEARAMDIAFLHPPTHVTGLRQKIIHETSGVRLQLCPEGANASVIGYPNADAPVLMTALAEELDDVAASENFTSVADTVLGAIVLSRAGYGQAVTPQDYQHPLVADAPRRTEAPVDLILQTAVAVRTTDRRPVMTELFGLATQAARAT